MQANRTVARILDNELNILEYYQQFRNDEFFIKHQAVQCHDIALHLQTESRGAGVWPTVLGRYTHVIPQIEHPPIYFREGPTKM